MAFLDLAALSHDRHFRIFLSSTFIDLKETREEIRKHIYSQKDIVFGMEDFPPDDRTDLDFIEDQIKRCDAFVLVIGMNDGSLTTDNLKYVEHEIKIAKRLKKPFFVFTPNTQTEGTKRFIPFMEEQGITTLAKVYSLSVKETDIEPLFARSYPAIRSRLMQRPYSGLVPAKNVEGAFHFNGFNKRVRQSPELSSALVTFSDAKFLVDRSTENHEEKKAAAFCAIRNFGSRLFPDGCTREVYFDGGSSVIVAANELLETCLRYGTDKANITMTTNSPHTQLSVILKKPSVAKNLIGPKLFPDNYYYKLYGTFLGEAMDKWPETSQKYWKYTTYEDIDCSESDLVNHFKDRFPNNNLIMFTSVSGYDTSEFKHINGPWVRSIPNYYFKRMMMESEAPTVILLDEKKWARRAIPKQSVCIYSKKYKANESAAPVCYSAGFSSVSQLNDFTNYFTNKEGFEVDELEDYPIGEERIYAACAYTQAFIDKLDSCC